MRPLTTSELLDLWQEGGRMGPVERTLRLVGTASDARTLGEMARLSIGERDLRLLQLREWLFGSRLSFLVNCPLCSALNEWDGDLGELRLQDHRPDDAGRRYACETDGYHLSYRLPNTEDLYGERDEKKILINCILSLEDEQGPCAPEDCPDTVLQDLARQIEIQDPQADIRFTVHCPACGHNWQTFFDIGGYLWAEIDSWAKHTLEEIYLLAFYFGWSEQAILSMAPGRRQLYVQMIRS